MFARVANNMYRDIENVNGVKSHTICYYSHRSYYGVFCFAWCGHILQSYFSGIGSITLLPQYQRVQVERWLEHRHGLLVKRQWAGSVLWSVTRDEYQVLGSPSIPARLDTLVYRQSISWLTSVGTTQNTVIRLGWSRIGLAVIILHAAGAGLIGRPAVISGRYNKWLQLQKHYVHFPSLQHTRFHVKHNYVELVMGNDHGFRGITCWPWQEESCVIRLRVPLVFKEIDCKVGRTLWCRL